MSAWIVTTHHIDALAHAATRANGAGTMTYRHEGRIVKAVDPTLVGRALLRANVDSVEARFPDIYTFEELPGSPRVLPEEYEFRMPARFSTVELLKALDCFEYQSCERDDWEDTEAFAICAALRRRLICQLPGYAEAAWAIGEFPEATTLPAAS